MRGSYPKEFGPYYTPNGEDMRGNDASSYSSYYGRLGNSALGYGARATRDIHGNTYDDIPDRKFAATFSSFEAAVFASIKRAASPAAVLDVPDAAKPRVDDIDWIVLGYDTKTTPVVDHLDELDAESASVLPDGTIPVLHQVPSYIGPPAVPCDNRDLHCCHQVIDGAATAEYRFDGAVDFATAASAAAGLTPVSCGLGVRAAALDQPCDDGYNGVLAVAAGSDIHKTVLTAAVEAESVKDPILTAVWSAGFVKSIHNLAVAPHYYLAAARIYMSVRTLENTNRVVALFCEGEASPTPIVVNVWRRYGGSRIYVELDRCPRCASAVKGYPMLTTCDCSFIKRLRYRGGNQHVGVWSEVYKPIETISDTLWDGYHLRVPGFIRGYWPDDNWEKMPSLPGRVELSTVIDSLSRTNDLSRDLVKMTQVYAGHFACHYKVVRKTDCRFTAWFRDARLPAAVSKEAVYGLASYVTAEHHKALLAQAILDHLLDWLRQQPQHHSALSALMRRFALVGDDPGSDLSLYLGGFNRKLDKYEMPTLAQICRSTISATVEFSGEGEFGPEYLVADSGRASDITVSMLICILESYMDDTRVAFKVTIAPHGRYTPKWRR